MGIIALFRAPAAPTMAGGPGAPADAALAEALARADARLVAAWAAVAAPPERGKAWLLVASWEQRRADLLALAAAPLEASGHALPGGPVPSVVEEAMKSTRRERFLRHDLQGCLTRASTALRMALRAAEDGVALSPRERRQAPELLAGVRSSLGDRRGEAAALEEAVALAPEDARLWLRLAEACGGARRFKRAEEARARALQLAGGKEEPSS